jgi:predicted nucleotidyltransferase
MPDAGARRFRIAGGLSYSDCHERTRWPLVPTRQLIEQRGDVLEVRLFGSLARGAARPGSDADLFIVVRDGAPPFLERIPNLMRHFAGVGVGCDVIAYTESEYQDSVDRNDHFAHAKLEKATVLARRGGTTSSAGGQLDRGR